MKISFSPSISKIQHNYKPAYLSFRADNKFSDTFEKNNKDYFNTTVLDSKGKECPAYIKLVDSSFLDTYNTFGLFSKGNILGKIEFAKIFNINSIWVSSLNTKEFGNNDYKGVGTELLKHAVRFSKDKGLDGKLSLYASYKPSPLVFYYKNNFRAKGAKSFYINTILNHCAKNNLKPEKFLKNTNLKMYLDKKGAEALLENKRLYENEFDLFRFFDKKKNNDIPFIKQAKLKNAFNQDLIVNLTKANNPRFKHFDFPLKKISLSKDNENIGHIEICAQDFGDKYTVVNYLFNDSKGKVKGVGSELIRQAIAESKQRGNKGRLKLVASYNPPPFVFYYKSNFRAWGKDKNLNPLISYCAHKNIPFEKLYHDNCIQMALEEDGAKKFLNKKRFFDNEKIETLFYKKFDNKSVEISLISEDDKEKYLIACTKEDDKINFEISCGVDIKDGNLILKDFNDNNALNLAFTYLLHEARNIAKNKNLKLVFDEPEILQYF